MRVEHIALARYRNIQNANIDLESGTGHPALERIYGKLSITMLAGINGSGKSALLSFIAHVFQNLQRSPNNIDGTFSLRYTLTRPEQRGVQCELFRNQAGELRIRVGGSISKRIVRDRSDRRIERPTTIPYAACREFLPSKVIVSASALGNGYPTERPAGFTGDRRLRVFDLNMLHGRHDGGFPMLSRGIARLLTRSAQHRHATSVLEDMLGAQFSGGALVMRMDAARGNAVPAWLPVNAELVRREALGEVKLIDLHLHRGDGSPMTLGTMSSGQKFLLARMLAILGEIHDNAIVIIDEPELHLDPATSRQIITLLILFFQHDAAHLFIATNTFSLLNAVPPAWIVQTHRGEFTRLTDTARTLFANEPTLAHQFYAARPHLVERTVRGRLTRPAAIHFRELFNALGESALRYDVYQALRAWDVDLEDRADDVDDARDEASGEGDDLA